MPWRHWPPSPPLRPSATWRSDRMAMGDHFTSSAAGAPAGLSSAAGVAAGERAANSAIIEVTTTDGNDLVLIWLYYRTFYGLEEVGWHLQEIRCESWKSRQN